MGLVKGNIKRLSLAGMTKHPMGLWGSIALSDTPQCDGPPSVFFPAMIQYIHSYCLTCPANGTDFQNKRAVQNKTIYSRHLHIIVICRKKITAVFNSPDLKNPEIVTLRNLSMDSTGVYRCTASNDVGEENCTIEVKQREFLEGGEGRPRSVHLTPNCHSDWWLLFQTAAGNKFFPLPAFPSTITFSPSAPPLQGLH